MSFSISSLFNQNSAAPAPAATPADPAQPNSTAPAPGGTAKITDANPAVAPVQSDGTAPNGVVPNNVETSESPLDQYKGLWDTDPNEVPVGEFTPEQLDPTKLKESMSKVDLTKSVTPDNLAAIQAGGEGATAALVETMNTVAQQSMLQSTVIANKLLESQLGKAIESMETKFSGMMREQNLTNSLNEQNPIYSNPAVAPVIDAVKSQLTIKHPNATTAQLTTMAQNFVKAMSNELNPSTPNDEGNNDTSKEEFDWSNFELS